MTPTPPCTMICLLVISSIPLPGTAVMGFLLLGGAAMFMRSPTHKRRPRAAR